MGAGVRQVTELLRGDRWAACWSLLAHSERVLGDLDYQPYSLFA
jgi:hypothetical protein